MRSPCIIDVDITPEKLVLSRNTFNFAEKLTGRTFNDGVQLGVDPARRHLYHHERTILRIQTKRVAPVLLHLFQDVVRNGLIHEIGCKLPGLGSLHHPDHPIFVHFTNLFEQRHRSHRDGGIPPSSPLTNRLINKSANRRHTAHEGIVQNKARDRLEPIKHSRRGVGSRRRHVEEAREEQPPPLSQVVRLDKVRVRPGVGGQALGSQARHHRQKCLVRSAAVKHQGPRPQVALLKGREVEPRDDAPVGAAAAAEGPVQIRVAGGIGVDDAPRREDELKVAHVVARPAVQAGEVGLSAAQGEPADSDAGGPASDDGQAEGVEGRGHVDPAVSGAHGDGFPVGGDGDLVEVGEVDGHAVLDVGSAGERCVAGALDGEGGLERRERLHDVGYILG